MGIRGERGGGVGGMRGEGGEWEGGGGMRGEGGEWEGWGITFNTHA